MPITHMRKHACSWSPLVTCSAAWGTHCLASAVAADTAFAVGSLQAALTTETLIASATTTVSAGFDTIFNAIRA
jgi:hypothetical protein